MCITNPSVSVIQLNVHQCTFVVAMGKVSTSNKHNTLIPVHNFYCYLIFYIVEPKCCGCRIQFYRKLACVNIQEGLQDLIMAFIHHNYYINSINTKLQTAFAINIMQQQLFVHYSPQLVLVSSHKCRSVFKSQISGLRHISYNIDSSDLYDIHTLNPRVCSSLISDIATYQANHSCLCYNDYMNQAAKLISPGHRY